MSNKHCVSMMSVLPLAHRSQCHTEDGQHVYCSFDRVKPKHDVIQGGGGGCTARLVATECWSHCEQQSCVHEDASFSLYYYETNTRTKRNSAR